MINQTAEILIIVGVVVGVALIVGSIIAYQCYCKKRLIRKAWRFTGQNDISFNN